MTRALLRVLLVEPQFVLRRTVATVARDLRLADVDEAANLGAAERMAQAQPYDVIVLSSDAALDAVDALARLVAAARAIRALLLLAPTHPEPVTPHAVLRKPVNVKAIVKLLASMPAHAEDSPPRHSDATCYPDPRPEPRLGGAHDRPQLGGTAELLFQRSQTEPAGGAGRRDRIAEPAKQLDSLAPP